MARSVYYAFDRDAKKADFLFTTNRKSLLEGLPLVKMQTPVINAATGSIW